MSWRLVCPWNWFLFLFLFLLLRLLLSLLFACPRLYAPVVSSALRCCSTPVCLNHFSWQLPRPSVQEVFDDVDYMSVESDDSEDDHVAAAREKVTVV